MKLAAVHRRSGTVLGILVLLVLTLLPAPAGATTVSIVNVTRSGSTVSVAGLASFSDEPFRLLGSDASGDSLPPGGELVGRDLVGFSMSTGVGDQLTLRWHLNPLMATDRGQDVSYASAFCVGSGGGNCWVITFIDPAGTPVTNSFVWSWRCASESCAIGAGDHIHSWETDRYDPQTKTALATVPFDALGITSGAQLRAVKPQHFGGEVYVTTPWWFLATAQTYPTWDGSSMAWTHRIATKDVSVAIGEPGQAPEQVAYPAPVRADEFNRYTVDLDVSDRAPGDYAIYVRACFGANNCGYATRAITL